MWENSRRVDKTGVLYADNRVKGFERFINFLLTYMFEIFLDEIKMSPVAKSTPSTQILVSHIFLNESIQVFLEKWLIPGLEQK